MWWWQDGGWTAFWMLTTMTIFWLVVVVVAFSVSRALGARGTGRTAAPLWRSPEDVLAERLALGEISVDQYRIRAEALRARDRDETKAPAA